MRRQFIHNSVNG
uniref:Uncharacterized protein n=1 Tax=Anguilla anguilla TaxID=7936 RepID=A0A0E9TEB4_ANGAN